MSSKDRFSPSDFLKNPWVIGAAIVAAATTILSLSIVNRKQTRRKKIHKRIRHLAEYRFVQSKNELLDYYEAQSWNNFNREQLELIFDRFKMYTDNPNHGSLTRREFYALLNDKLGCDDAQVVESFFKFWDQNHDGVIKFVELLRGLNLICNGSKHDQFRKFFNIYDLNGDNSITMNEFEHIVKVFFPKLRPSQVKDEVRALFASGDANHDTVLSFQEFVHLADRGSFADSLTTKNSFFQRFCALVWVK